MWVADVCGKVARWRALARRLLSAGIGPGEVLWVDSAAGQAALDLFGQDVATLPAGDAKRWSVPRDFVALAEYVACHRDPQRWAVLYRVLWRIARGGERDLLRISVDDDVHALELLRRQVRRAAHFMRAFVRFRRVVVASGERYVAWHRPEHRVLRLAVPFFAGRMGATAWTLFTPDESADCDGETLLFGPGLPEGAPEGEDDVEALWQTYYGATFNPSRVNERALVKEMPMRHWATMPEGRIIDELLRDAPRRIAEQRGRAAGGLAEDSAR